MNPAGASILITGGGRGIGRYLVDKFGEFANVYVLDKDVSLCGEIAAVGNARVKAAPCDVTNPEDVDAVLGRVFSEGFSPQVLINNAGLIHSEPLINILSRTDKAHSVDSWRKTLSANLDSVFFVTRRVAEQMLSTRTKGVVISISSISARGNAGQSAYSAAKAGVNALTKTWARELGPLGLRFAAVAPGFIDTPSTRSALSETVLNNLIKQIPLRKLGEFESVYQSVLHVIENDYCSGTVLEVDGGLV